MSRIVCIILWVAMLQHALAQDHYQPGKALSSEELFLKENNNRVFTRPGERYLALDYSPRIGSFQRHRFFPGDAIKFRLRNQSTRFDEEIYSVTDSSFTFVLINEAAGRMEYREVPYHLLKTIRIYRRIPWVTEGAFMLPLAGLIYIGADFFNRGIDGQRFTTDRQALMVGGAIMATGFFCYKLSFSTVRLKRNGRLKVLKTY